MKIRVFFNFLKLLISIILLPNLILSNCFANDLNINPYQITPKQQNLFWLIENDNIEKTKELVENEEINPCFYIKTTENKITTPLFLIMSKIEDSIKILLTKKDEKVINTLNSLMEITKTLMTPKNDYSLIDIYTDKTILHRIADITSWTALEFREENITKEIPIELMKLATQHDTKMLYIPNFLAQTPFFTIILSSDEKLLELYIKKSNKNLLNYRDLMGNTPYEHAKKYGKPKIVKLLEEHEIDKLIANTYPRTPIIPNTRNFNKKLNMILNIPILEENTPISIPPYEAFKLEVINRLLNLHEDPYIFVKIMDFYYTKDILEMLEISKITEKSISSKVKYFVKNISKMFGED